VGATMDGKFRAFDSRSGKELWVTRLPADVNAVPITWLGKNGKQYVAVFACGTPRGDAIGSTLFVYSLP
jgi:glucose dehydrogenase